jgi:DNA-binding transcriptional ArsR family regulator
MVDIFDVVADATRRDVLQVLLDRYLSTDASGGETGGEISVGEIVTALGQSQPTVSKHLKVLRDHGLVVVREEGQHRYYSLDAGPLEELEDWLIPFLSADFDEDAASEGETGGDGAADDDETAVFAAWAGADVGETIGRRVAEGTHQARTAIHDATEQVTKRLPKIGRKRPFHKP